MLYFWGYGQLRGLYLDRWGALPYLFYLNLFAYKTFECDIYFKWFI